MNTDLSKSLPGETALEYYKRCRVVLEDENKALRKSLEEIRDLMAGAHGNSSFHPRVRKMAEDALANDKVCDAAHKA